MWTFFLFSGSRCPVWDFLFTILASWRSRNPWCITIKNLFKQTSISTYDLSLYNIILYVPYHEWPVNVRNYLSMPISQVNVMIRSKMWNWVVIVRYRSWAQKMRRHVRKTSPSRQRHNYELIGAAFIDARCKNRYQGAEWSIICYILLNKSNILCLAQQQTQYSPIKNDSGTFTPFEALTYRRARRALMSP